MLSLLQHLSLGCDDWSVGPWEMYSENLQWLSGPSSLEYVEMSFVNLSKASDHWLLAINKLPSLLELRLDHCDLSHIQRLSYVNFKARLSLGVRGNNFNPVLPDWIFSLSHLDYLSPSDSNLVGPFPNASTGNLCNLGSLDLSNNKLSGNVMDAFESVSVGCLSNRLETLDLSHNLFTSRITASFEKFVVLENLDISSNQLNGSFPKKTLVLSPIYDFLTFLTIVWKVLYPKFTLLI